MPPPKNPEAPDLFKRHFGYTAPHSVRVPVSVELLGAGSESQEGLVSATAVNRYAQLASGPRTDGKIELLSAGFAGSHTFWMSDLKSESQTPWAEPIKATLRQLRKRKVHFSGFNAAVSVDPPFEGCGTGLAAMMLATCLSIRRLHPFALTETGATIPPKKNAKGELPPLPGIEKLAYAKLCQTAIANETALKAPLPIFGDATTVLQRAMTSLHGKAWHVTGSDLRFLTIGHAPLIGEVLVLSVPEAPLVQELEEPTEADEIDFPAACVSGVQKLGAKSLRSVEMKFLEDHKTTLTNREYVCARYVVSEIQRVVAAERALREDDHRQFGQYMCDSHESARKTCRSSSPELDFLVELARGHPGCLGARAIYTATLSLVAYHQAERFMKHLAGTYEQAMRSPIRTFVCQIVDGVS